FAKRSAMRLMRIIAANLPVISFDRIRLQPSGEASNTLQEQREQNGLFRKPKCLGVARFGDARLRREAGVLGDKFAPGAANYCSNTFSTSPILRCSFPPAFSAVPRSCKFGLPVAVPAFSFTLPFASLNPPLILSFVLDFIKTKSRTINAAVVIDFDQSVREQTSKTAAM